MDWLLVSRVFTAVTLGFAVFEMLLMMVYYRQRILPLRHKISEGEIIAPPAGWTFAYHAVVFGWLLTLIGTRLQSIDRHAPSNFFDYVGPLLAVAMLVVIGKFQNYYGQNLRRAERKREGPTFPAP